MGEGKVYSELLIFPFLCWLKVVMKQLTSFRSLLLWREGNLRFEGAHIVKQLWNCKVSLQIDVSKEIRPILSLHIFLEQVSTFQHVSLDLPLDRMRYHVEEYRREL